MDKENPKSEACFEAFPVPGYVAANPPQKNLKRRLGTLEDVTNVQTKKRQRSCKTRDEIIQKYKQDLTTVWLDKPSVVKPWFKELGLTLNCKAIDEHSLPSGFTRVSEDRYQYNFTDPDNKSTKRYRPVAYRMSFLNHNGFYDNTLTVSHLCHNNWCYNWDHHVLESLHLNKARNGCPAGPSCRHKFKCLIPGIYSED